MGGGMEGEQDEGNEMCGNGMERRGAGGREGRGSGRQPMSTLPAPRQAAGLEEVQLWVRGKAGCCSARSNST